MNVSRTRIGLAFLLMVGVAIGTTLCIAALTPPVASAGNFCGGSTLAPYGQGGDRCFSEATKGLDYSMVSTHERAGCADIADTGNNLIGEWQCAAAGYTTSASLYVGEAFETYHKAVIRNNNTVNSGVFDGGFNCVQGC